MPYSWEDMFNATVEVNPYIRAKCEKRDEDYILHYGRNCIYTGCKVLNRPPRYGDIVVVIPSDSPDYPFRGKISEANTITVMESRNTRTASLRFIRRGECKTVNVYLTQIAVVEPTEKMKEAFIANLKECFQYRPYVDNQNLRRMVEIIYDNSNSRMSEFYQSVFSEISDLIPRCSVCNEMLMTVISRVVNNDNVQYMCRDCYESYYTRCDHCGDHYHSETDESDVCRDGSHLCPQCRKRLFVLPYHHMYPMIKFYGSGVTMPYMGVELEVDEGGESNNNVQMVMETINRDNDIFAYCSHDGSLEHGFEIITQPATLEYHMSIKGIYSELFNKLRQAGYYSHDTQTCGLHVHFNRDFYRDNEELYISRLLYLVDKFWDEISLFARRNQYRLERYSRKIERAAINNYIRCSNKSNDHDYHYYAVNIANNDTIEFRMFKGTLNVDTFIVTLNFVQNCIIAAKEKSAEAIQRMSFEELITGKLMKKYWKRRTDLGGLEE